jgi:hypothetical protein
MADTETSNLDEGWNLDVMAGDMAGTKTTMLGTEMEE